MANTTERMTYDPPKLTPDEATELCVYHLRCAAALFQLVPDDGNESLRAEILRQREEFSDMSYKPAMAWAACILELYEELKRRHR